MWSTNFITLAVLFIAIIHPSIAQIEEAGAASTLAPTAGGGGGGSAGGAGGAGGADDAALVSKLVTFTLFEPFTFNCTDTQEPDTIYEWYRNGTLFVPTGAKGQPTLEAGGSRLHIRRAHEDDWGNYTCRIGRAVANAWQAEALNVPRVPPNTNVVEGQKFTITCKVIGKPHHAVTWWYRPSDDLNFTQLVGGGNASGAGGVGGDKRVVTRDSPAGVPGAVLEMSDTTREDAGEYACRAGWPEEHEPRDAISTVRVKDVYAALWPFLGICLEVFVLCAIILVYEKRRTKPELDDSDADTHDQ